MIKLNLELLTFLLNVGVPLLTGLIVHHTASSRVKAITAFVLTAVATFIAVLIAGGGILTKQTVIAFVLGYLTQGVSYEHLWKPTGVAGAVNAAGDVGIFANPEDFSSPTPFDDLVAAVKLQLESGATQVGVDPSKLDTAVKNFNKK